MHAHLKKLTTAVLATALITGLAISPSASALAPSYPAATQATTAVVDAARPLYPVDTQVPTMARVLEHLATIPKLTPRQRLVAHVTVLRKRIADLGRKQVGDAYRAGNSGPNAFDCSGLTRYVFKQITGRTLPHYSGAQYQMAKKVSRKKAQPGDLVFYLRGGAHHVGLYLGNGKMVHAIGSNRGVKVQPIFGPWYSRHYSGMGRILPA
ncbi:MAG: NlpC/P60 family protein [Actinomycetota bacterium]|nr:NlpC/P60 family protein [Actinomycetota bacterium]